ncbi:unnamed protein product [Leptosia nina]|uniref:Uncharacterized protein n=1 Tax=Leptosia nina TaxID=320188 RepID=A0AAV1JJ26_9NEOP
MALMYRERESIDFNKSIFYRAPCAEYIRRHSDDDDVFFCKRYSSRGASRRSLRGVATVSRRIRVVPSPPSDTKAL